MWFHKKKTESSTNRKIISIRMEAIGGQGANSAGKILAEAAVLGMHYTGCHFASFGSEKRGSPVQSFVRFSTENRPIRSAYFSDSMNLLVIFHQDMIDKHSSSLDNVNTETDILINSSLSPREIEFKQILECNRIMTIDGGKIAKKERCGLNAVILGASLRALPEISKEMGIKSLENFFSKLSPTDLKRNLNGFNEGYNLVQISTFNKTQLKPRPNIQNEVVLGWENAPMGGLITNPGNTVLKDNSLSRNGTVPQFFSEICFHCGYCDMVCPDYCFVWEQQQDPNKGPILKGIDYQYCKACQKCVEVCPVQALKLVQESAVPAEQKLKKFSQVNFNTENKPWTNVDWNLSHKENLTGEPSKKEE